MNGIDAACAGRAAQVRINRIAAEMSARCSAFIVSLRCADAGLHPYIHAAAQKQ